MTISASTSSGGGFRGSKHALFFRGTVRIHFG